MAIVEALTKKRSAYQCKHFHSKLIAVASYVSNVLISLWHVHTPLVVAVVFYPKISYLFKVRPCKITLHHISSKFYNLTA